METLTQSETASPATEPKLYLQPEHFTAEEWRHWRSVGLASAGVHVAVIVALLVFPEIPIKPYQEPPRIVRRVTPLYIPTEFTQKAPNKGKVEKELTSPEVAPHPMIKSPTPAPAAKRIPPPAPAPLPPPLVTQVQPKPVFVEAPKIADNQPTQQLPPQTMQVAPIAPEQPRIALQNVAPATTSKGPAPGRGAFVMPNTSVEAAVRALSHSGLTSGVSVGDGDEGTGGMGLNLPPSAGRPRSSLQLKSDPLGVDFKPYLQQVLAAVRRNWGAVYPEAARLGQRGQVKLEFAISKQGTVAKIVFSNESGAKALDQAAVAAISASNPLPPLPTEFKGDRVVLEMTFLYNMPR
jgi:TonB family protein